MRRRIWIQVIASCALMVIATSSLHLFLGRVGKLSIIFAIISSFCLSAGFIGWSAVIAERDNIVLRQGEKYTDLGPGNLPLGIMKFWSEGIVYNPRPRDLRQSITLPARDGSVLLGNVMVTWQPDRSRLADFLEQQPDTRLSDLVTAHLQAWSKQNLPGELYFNSPPSLNVSGITVTALTLTDITAQAGPMNRYIWDSTHLLQSIVNEIEDEDRIETKREELKHDYPDRAHRIDRLIEQRKAELRRRGLRENR